MKSRLIITLAVIVGLGGAIGSGVWLWSGHDADQSSTTLTLYGNVDIREVELAFEVAGRIEKELVEEGDRIEQGELLATLEPERFQYDVARAKFSLSAQEQMVAELEAGTRPEEIRRSKAQLNAVEARIFETKQHYERTQKLFPKGATSREEYDDAKAAYDTAKADLHVAQASLDLALAGPRIQEINAAKAKRELNRAELDLATWSLSKTKLQSPCRGIVRQRILEPGAMASADHPVFTLALDDPLWARVYASEPDLGRIQLGMKAYIRTDSFPRKQFTGWVGYISPTAEFTPKTVQTEELRTRLVYEVRIYVRNPEGELRLGMPATVTIDLTSSGGAPADTTSGSHSDESGSATQAQSSSRTEAAAKPPAQNNQQSAEDSGRRSAAK